MAIQRLAPEVAQLIAAGEVITRPADAVKELVENAIDAVSQQRLVATDSNHRIDVEIAGGGAQLIRVTDTGCGLARAELALAFERHATSKLATIEDLAWVGTLGFRGEALASIAAVAQIEMHTYREGEPTGASLQVHAGAAGQVETSAWSRGTSVRVANLFYNLPVRQRFLRSAASEATYIAHLICQYALAYPEIQFVLNSEGRIALRSPGDGDLTNALAAVYGPSVARQMRELIPARQLPGEGVALDGYVGLPENSWTNRSHISLFVNRRWVQNRALVFAVSEAYRDMLPPGRHPVAAINLTIPSADLDVNIHPGKAEVRLRRERLVFAQLQQAIRNTLAAARPVRNLSVSPQPLPGTDTLQQQGELSLSPNEEVELPAAAPPSTSTAARLPLLRVIGQIASTFIVAEGPNGLYLIDQHRAHERLHYDRLRSSLAASEIESQQLLEPLTLDLEADQQELVQKHQNELKHLGIVLEEFGDGAYLLRAVPPALTTGDVLANLTGLLDDLLAGSDSASWQEQALASIACHGSVRAGQTLSLPEMRALVEQLERSSIPQTCPHGAPTIMHFSQAQLEKEFMRR